MGIWSKQVRRLHALLRRRGQTPEDAEDLVQEAFLRLHVFLESGREVKKPDAFLARTALNLSIDRHRSDRSGQFVAEAVENLPLVDLRATPEESLYAEQRLRQIGEVLEKQVSRRAREVFFLHRLEGFTHEEIARRLRVSVRTVEKDIARAVTLIWMERHRHERR
jgi:RNA polymerase sigma factor (sigma-70 family)